MKIISPVRYIPDGSHHNHPDLFGDDERFELSTIRAEDASIAMDMLIGNYSAPIDAVIRELVVNAVDSHREADQRAPVQLVIPTPEQPFLVVRDHGLGLSPEDMVSVYTRPAASTKRGSDASTGGLGIGAKAPFTVTDRFSVHGVKDGVSATLAMARIDGQLKHLVRDITLADPETPNGVEVVVPIEAHTTEEWWKALSRVHFWWDEGLVEIVNRDQSPLNLPTWTKRLLGEGGTSLADTDLGESSVIVSPKLRTSVALMGQIAYALPEGLAPTRLSVLFRVPVGTLTVAPTRESLVDTNANREVLRAMYERWQEEIFAPVAERLMDPATSIWSIFEMQTSLGERAALAHLAAWISRTRLELTASGALPRYETTRIAQNLLPDKRWSAQTLDVRPHGVPDERTAKRTDLAEVLTLTRLDQPVVFCDSDELTEALRRLLSKWAREVQMTVVLVSRRDLEAARFPRFWSWPANQENTRPFADPGQIEWIDPTDIRISRSAKKKAVAVTDDTRVEVLQMHNGLKATTMTVTDVLRNVSSTPNHWVIVDTLSQLRELPGFLPENIVAVPSGDRAAKRIRELAGKRALTVAEFSTKQAGIVLRALTPVQRRWVADIQLSRNDGITRFFAHNTAWIEETEDADVRAVAETIRAIVARANALRSQRSETSERHAQMRAGIHYGEALQRLLNDPNWLVANGALGTYLPALMAAQSVGVNRQHSWLVDNAMVVDHIRATIATQLVKQ